MRPHHPAIPWLNRLAKVCGWLAEHIGDRLDRWKWRLSYCPNCGENRYYGKSCQEKLKPQEVSPWQVKW